MTGWVEIEVKETTLTELRKLIERLDPHEHYEGMNECIKCEENILDGALRLLKTSQPEGVPVIDAARDVVHMVRSTHEHTCWFDSLARLMKALEQFDERSIPQNGKP